MLNELENELENKLKSIKSKGSASELRAAFFDIIYQNFKAQGLSKDKLNSLYRKWTLGCHSDKLCNDLKWEGQIVIHKATLENINHLLKSKNGFFGILTDVKDVLNSEGLNFFNEIKQFKFIKEIRNLSIFSRMMLIHFVPWLFLLMSMSNITSPILALSMITLLYLELRFGSTSSGFFTKLAFHLSNIGISYLSDLIQRKNLTLIIPFKFVLILISKSCEKIDGMTQRFFLSLFQGYYRSVNFIASTIVFCASYLKKRSQVERSMPLQENHKQITIYSPPQFYGFYHFLKIKNRPSTVEHQYEGDLRNKKFTL